MISIILIILMLLPTIPVYTYTYTHTYTYDSTHKTNFTKGLIAPAPAADGRKSSAEEKSAKEREVLRLEQRCCTACTSEQTNVL